MREEINEIHFFLYFYSLAKMQSSANAKVIEFGNINAGVILPGSKLACPDTTLLTKYAVRKFPFCVTEFVNCAGGVNVGLVPIFTPP